MTTTARWHHYPLVAQEKDARSWLVSQANLGRAPKTVEAYGRAHRLLDKLADVPTPAGLTPRELRRTGGTSATGEMVTTLG